MGLLLAGLLGLSSAPATAAEKPRAIAQNDRGGVIDIPGIGPIPIPLPPGSRVFGPNGPAPQSRPGRPPDTKAQRPAPLGLDELFVKLAGAQDEDEARAAAASIRRIWARSGSETADLLAERARLAEELDDRNLAKELLDHVIVLEPKWAEALVRRSSVKTALGDAEGAAGDLEQAVRLEPRRFDAFAALGALEEARGRKKSALEAYRRSLQIDPQQDDMIKKEERLRIEVEGRDI